jgi:di/tricarboxylate transporter
MKKVRKRALVLVGIAVFLLMRYGLRIGHDQPEIGKTLAVAAVMAFFWITETIPLAATALI